MRCKCIENEHHRYCSHTYSPQRRLQEAIKAYRKNLPVFGVKMKKIAYIFCENAEKTAYNSPQKDKFFSRKSSLVKTLQVLCGYSARSQKTLNFALSSYAFFSTFFRYLALFSFWTPNLSFLRNRTSDKRTVNFESIKQKNSSLFTPHS